MPRVFFPPEFKDEKDYIEHLECEVEKLRKSILFSEMHFRIIRRWSLTAFGFIVLFIFLRLLFKEKAVSQFFDIATIIVFSSLFIFWLTVRNIMRFHYTKKIEYFKHDVEDLEHVYNTHIKNKEGDEWVKKEKNIEAKARMLRLLIKQDKEHFKRFIAYIVYFLIGAIIVFILKFGFGVF